MTLSRQVFRFFLKLMREVPYSEKGIAPAATRNMRLRACPSRSDAVRTSCGQAANDQGLPARSTRFRCQSSAVIELQHKRTLTAPGGIYTGLNASQDASAVARHPRRRGTTRSHGPRQARHDSSTPRLPRYSWASAGLPSMGMAQLKAEQEFPATVGPTLV